MTETVNKVQHGIQRDAATIVGVENVDAVLHHVDGTEPSANTFIQGGTTYLGASGQNIGSDENKDSSAYHGESKTGSSDPFGHGIQRISDEMESSNVHQM